jgi:YbgC/YbaW family acyl-CoA thioester hydrolase
MELKTYYKIRFNDCDPFKHLNNSAYIDYMLNAREDHLKQFHNISMTDMYAKGLSWMVSNHEIAYLRPASYDEQVCIQSVLIKAGEGSLLVEMIMFDESCKLVKALLWTTFTHVNLQTGKRDNHPAWFQEIADSLQKTELQRYKTFNDRLTALRAVKEQTS